LNYIKRREIPSTTQDYYITKKLIKMDQKIHTVITKLRDKFQERYKSRLVDMILFGSQARGDADPDSDIDVLEVLKGSVQPDIEVSRTIDYVSDICLKNDVVISYIYMDENRFKTRNGPLLRNIRREGISI